MSEAVPIAVTRSIRRECGFDEVWLQDQIAENPSCLQLGELELVSRERQQAGGGRLDILLKNPEDDSMYEVEVMLGETDEKHIIHTIEYWDREKRKWPQRQHFAVLVAETVTSRFFNVIQLLSHCIPVIAVQANIIEVDGKKALHFRRYSTPTKSRGTCRRLPGIGMKTIGENTLLGRLIRQRPFWRWFVQFARIPR